MLASNFSFIYKLNFFPFASLITVFRILFLLLIVFHTSILLSQRLPLDEEGWTVLTPSSDSRIIYVSSTEGDDETATFYQLGDNVLAQDVFSPTENVKAFKTISAAEKLARSGQPDWILLKAGDSWLNEKIPTKSGRNAQERFVIAFYGNAQGRPELIYSERLRPLNVVQGNYSHIAIVGLRLYCSRRDPDSQDFPGIDTIEKEEFHPGIRLLMEGSNLLLEDLDIQYFNYGITMSGKINDVVLRRSIIRDAYNPISSFSNGEKKSSGIYFSGLTNYTIEECVFDRNGWSPDLPNSGRNMFNHNIYCQSTNQGDIRLLNNIIARGSSHGTQQRSGAIVENNFFVENALALFVSGNNNPGRNNAADTTRLINNVIQQGIRMNPVNNKYPTTGAVDGINVNFTFPDQIYLVQNNIVSHRTIAEEEISTIPQAITLTDDCTPVDNIVYNWKPRDRGFQDTFDPEWKNPERDAASYHASLGREASLESFLEKCRERKLRVWPAEYTANVINEYIREGFNMELSEQESPVPPSDESPETPFSVRIKLWLEGYSKGKEMTTQLVDQGVLPQKQPFENSVWEYKGLESVSSFPQNIVDWVLVMLRDEEGNIKDQLAVLVREDGQLMDILGNELITFIGIKDSTSYISLHHKSHLGIMSRQPVKSGELIDFTLAISTVAGNEQQKIVDDQASMISGDFDGNGLINNQDINLWRQTGAALNTYDSSDADGNGIVNNLDYNLWTRNRSKIGLDILKR